MAEQGHLVHGLDLSARMVEQAVAKSTAVDPRPRFEVADVSDPPLPPESFDVVVARHVLWTLPEPAVALTRWVTLLGPGGILVLVEGRWDTGAGLGADEVEALVGRVATVTTVTALDDPALWGREITDERFLVVAAR
jgi:SAM-dependent methyltransferase